MAKKQPRRPRGTDGGSVRDPASLQAAIDSRGFQWQAGQTTLSELPPEEQKSRLGLAVTPAQLQATAAAVKSADTLRAIDGIGAPASVDWRNKNGNWVTPIRDQSSCGSCVSFGTLATLESRIRIACNNAGLAIDLAEAHLFYCGCGNCCATGWNFGPALDFCKNTGITTEANFPYTPGNQPCKASLPIYTKITAWSQVLAVADRKNVIATKGPVVGGLAIYQDFFAYKTGVYRHVSGALAGYHAVSVVGYDDTQSCWICKNSWGPGWGDAGFFKIAYGEAGMDTQFAAYDMDVKCPVPDNACSQYVPALRSILVAAKTNPQLRACLRHYVCHKPGIPPRCTAAHRELAKRIIAVLQRCPQYREPFCRALN